MNMKIISRRFHAVLDYLSGIILIAAPWLLQFRDSSTGAAVAIFAGVLILGMSIMTNYEGGLVRAIPMGIHLNLDVLLGVLLTLSPWILNFKEEVYLPHVIMGLLALFSGLFTTRTSLVRQAS
jgi:hypothetical protein